MDLWNVDDDTIRKVAAGLAARQFDLPVSSLTPMRVRRLSGLYADIEVVEHANAKRHQVTVYETDLDVYIDARRKGNI